MQDTKYGSFFFLIVFLTPHNPIITQNKKAVINCERRDGLGANVQQIIGAALFAELNNNYDFFYQPFKRMAHNYGGKEDDSVFLSNKEKLLNLIGNFPVVNDAIEQGYEIYVQEFENFLNANICKCEQSQILKKIKKVFRANKDRDNYFDTNFFNIAIHIRRANQHDSRIYGTDVPNCFYLEIINKLREIYLDRYPLLFHIYSQGEINNFVEFKSPDIVLHINESADDAYAAMALADVLVAGRSSFSYTAGYLSDSTVYYIPYMHAPLPHWIPLEELLKKKLVGIEMSEIYLRYPDNYSDV
jgi:hypothetical protein